MNVVRLLLKATGNGGIFRTVLTQSTLFRGLERRRKNRPPSLDTIPTIVEKGGAFLAWLVVVQPGAESTDGPSRAAAGRARAASDGTE